MRKLFLALFVSLFSLQASAVSIQTIDDFESGALESHWSILEGASPDNAGVYGSLWAFFDNGEGPALYYPSQGDWMMVVRAGEPTTRVSMNFTSDTEGTLEMSVFFSAIGFSASGTQSDFNDFSSIKLDGSEIFFIDVVSTGMNGAMDNTGWLDLSLPLAAGNHTLELLVQNVGREFFEDSMLAVDDLRVTSSVPEPPTSSMMLSALGLMALVAIRRKAALARIDR